MGILKGGIVGIFIMLLPVEAPMAPISTAGMAISRHPMEAVQETVLDVDGDLHDKAR